MSSTGGTEVFRECTLFLDRGYLENFEALFLSDLDVDDTDVEQLIQWVKLKLGEFLGFVCGACYIYNPKGRATVQDRESVSIARRLRSDRKNEPSV